MCSTGNAVWGKPHRGFESRPLRLNSADRTLPPSHRGPRRFAFRIRSRKPLLRRNPPGSGTKCLAVARTALTLSLAPLHLPTGPSWPFPFPGPAPASFSSWPRSSRSRSPARPARNSRGRQPGQARRDAVEVAHRSRPGIEAAEGEAGGSPGPRSGGARRSRDSKTPDVVLNELRPALVHRLQVAAKRGPTSSRSRPHRRRGGRAKEWEEVYRQRIAFRQHAEQQQAAYGFDFDTGAQPGASAEVLDAAAVLWAAVMFFVAMRLGQERAAGSPSARPSAPRPRCCWLAPHRLRVCRWRDAGPQPWAVREDAKLTADD